MKRLIAVCLFALVAAPAPRAWAVTTVNSNLILAASANSMIQIVDASLVLTPTGTDYDNNYVQVAGASGLRVNVKTNSSGGLVLRIKCADAAPQIALSDLLVRTLTPPGPGGTALSTFTPISATDQNLWSTTQAQHPWLTVTTDIKIQNLINYDDAAGAGTTNYTNTLTFTVISL